MAEIIRNESDGSVSFGDYSLKEKTKVSDFKGGNGIYKVKTFSEITKLECDDVFVYESVPGTKVFSFADDKEKGSVSFEVEGAEYADITIGLEPETEYDIKVGDAAPARMKANLGGKLTISVEFGDKKKVSVLAKKA